MTTIEYTRQISLSELITDKEIVELKKVVAARKPGSAVHNVILKWLDKQPAILERFRTNGVIKCYGSYLFESYLNLT